MQSRNGSDSDLCACVPRNVCSAWLLWLAKTHRFLLVSVHASSAKDDVFASLCDASRLPRWLVWCYRALRPAGDDKEQDLSFLGPQKTPQSFAPEQIQRVRRPLWRRESPGSKSAALTSRQPLMPDLSSLLGIVGGAVLAIYLVRYYREHYTRTGWLRSGQEASHRLHRA